MKILGTNHVALLTSNFAAMRAFYTEVLEFPVVGAYQGFNIIFLDTGNTTIELIERGSEFTPTVGAWDHFAFTVEDTDATTAELEARGVVFHKPPANFPTPPETRLSYFKDPDGNILELVQSLGAGLYPKNGLR